MLKTSLDLTITALSHDGRGVARCDGKAIFVAGALPGEEVRAQISAHHPRFNEAQLLQVHTPAPGRRIPACPHFGVCGGCNLQHLDIALQSAHKEQVLRDALERIGGIVPEDWLPPVVGSSWGYRCRTRLGVDRSQAGEIRFGYRGKGSHRLTDLTDCPVLHPTLLALLPKLRAHVLPVKQIVEVDLAQGDEDGGLRLHLAATLRKRDLETLGDFAREEGLSLWLCGPGAQTLPPLEPVPLTYRLPEFAVKFHYTPADFTQINLALNRTLVTTVLGLLAPVPGERVLDLYCGLGNFTLPLARVGVEVVGMEGEADLVRRARHNARHNAMPQARFQCADLDREDGSLIADGFDKVLLDPPRIGAKTLIHRLAKSRAQRIVYVSCDPGTLARDAAHLVREGGYRLKAAGLVDMFPHTAHGEAVALFARS